LSCTEINLNFCTAKETVIRLKRAHRTEEIISNYSSDEGIYLEATGNSKNSAPKE
jgi:hypothetical protein